MTSVQRHIQMLGMRVRDRVTGLEGVVTSVSFDLYGCVQTIVNPGRGTDGKPMELVWFDIARLEIIDSQTVMPPPNFESGPVAEGLKGPAEKPAFNKS